MILILPSYNYNNCGASGHSAKLVLETKDGVQQFHFSSIENLFSYKHHPTSSANNWRRRENKRRRNGANINAGAPGEPLRDTPSPVYPAGDTGTIGGPRGNIQTPAPLGPAEDDRTLGVPPGGVQAPGQPQGDAPAPAEPARDPGTPGGRNIQDTGRCPGHCGKL